jgi:hypothetical protein
MKLIRKNVLKSKREKLKRGKITAQCSGPVSVISGAIRRLQQYLFSKVMKQDPLPQITVKQQKSLLENTIYVYVRCSQEGPAVTDAGLPHRKTVIMWYMKLFCRLLNVIALSTMTICKQIADRNFNHLKFELI